MGSKGDGRHPEQEVNCPICRGEDFQELPFPDGSTVRLCLHCAFGRTCGPPPQDRLGVYEEESVTNRWSRTQAVRKRRWEKLFPGGLKADAEVPEWHLDVGTGAGDFALWMREKGWRSAGIDLTPRLVRLADERGLPCVVAGMLDLPCRPRKLSLLTFMDTLEHVSDPEKALREARQALVPGGHLWVTCPNAASWAARTLKTHWPWWTPPDHRVHFSPKSLRLLMEREGFQVVSLRSVEEKSVYLDSAVKLWSQLCRKWRLSERINFGLRPLISIPVKVLLWLLSPFCFYLEKRLKGGELVVIAKADQPSEDSLPSAAERSSS